MNWSTNPPPASLNQNIFNDTGAWHCYIDNLPQFKPNLTRPKIVDMAVPGTSLTQSKHFLTTPVPGIAILTIFPQFKPNLTRPKIVDMAVPGTSLTQRNPLSIINIFVDKSEPIKLIYLTYLSNEFCCNTYAKT